ncbi:MAG: energy-coupling factor ABC transporter permease [Betaproteobacteria bacterium]|jgi:Cobalt uptake substrate-specific transmembrane region.|nr:energy-coupling factor ABC transporter permease [Betaproteobacteria bacterium]
MHIEPGYLSAPKVALADAAALTLMATHLPAWLKSPVMVGRSLVAAIFFTGLMQMYHWPVGPSELHFIGAMPIYLTLGFVPTLMGFGMGLLIQGLVFVPTDLLHLGVNTLSLAVPLLVVHHTLGHRLEAIDLRTVLKLDACYYSGVTLMVGFWLSLSDLPTAFSAWLAFASSYLVLVLIEPVISVALLTGLGRLESGHWLRRFCQTSIRPL